MKPLRPEDPETKSADVLAENVAALKVLFPEAFTEGKIDFAVLMQLLGGALEDREEKYGLSWHGKRQARQLALTPSTGTLRPCPEESVDWDTTQNLMIEGDNLEVLKLLQKSYAGKVKLIYIDPPYNTGKDFVYPDNFRDNIRNYLELTGQLDGEGKKLSSNTEASGRYHTDWLNMMMPRLMVARRLLRQDGFLLISINDVEQPRLRQLCDEVFGEENFVALLVWLKGKEGGNDNEGFGPHHEYVLCYAQSAPSALTTIALDTKDTTRHVTVLPEENLVVPSTSTYRDGELFQLINLSKQKDYRVQIPLRDGSIMEWESYCPQKTIDEFIRIGKLFVGARRVPYVKSFLADEKGGTKPSSVIDQEYGTTKAGGIAIRSLFGSKEIFPYPKPPQLVARLVKILCSSGAGVDGADRGPIVMDFFAGSGTTAQGVWMQNARDGVERRFVLVQLPAPLDVAGDEGSAGAALCDELRRPRVLSELTKERLRRAGKSIRNESPIFSGDLGFRVFKLDSTNIRPWDPDRENLERTLDEAVEHIKPERSEADVLFELLLKLGLDLTVPIEKRGIAGKEVHSIGAGALIACLAKEIGAADVEPLALGIVGWQASERPAGESTIVFRDSAFADDVAKTNLTAILEQHGLGNVRSL